VLSDTQLTAVSPPGIGMQHVTVTAPGGSNAHSSQDVFTYVARPKVNHISPSSGPTAGGTTVTITGTGFLHATEVFFGGTTATRVVVVSDTKITVRSPAAPAGVRDITVVAPGGTSAVGSADRFTYH
jgi:large repetitive protein